MQRWPVVLSLLLATLAGCESHSDLVVLQQTLKEAADAPMTPGDFGGMVGSVQKLYWVEGTLENRGQTEAREIVVRFRCTDGTSTKVLVAQVPPLAAGGTATFMTARLKSPAPLRLLEEPPEIHYSN
jgi:hypothetical protein